MGLFEKKKTYTILHFNTGDYVVNRNIFHVGLFLIVLLGFFVIVQGYKNNSFTYLTCKTPSNDYASKCENQFYHNNICYNNDIRYVQIKSFLLKYDLCNKEYLFNGESYGNKPSFFANNFGLLVFLILLICLLVNHFVYNKKFKFNFGGVDDVEDEDNAK